MCRMFDKETDHLSDEVITAFKAGSGHSPLETGIGIPTGWLTIGIVPVHADL